jgi:rhomboid protease GluP
MLNEPPSEKKRPQHPLERREPPLEAKPSSTSESPTRGTLHIKVVSPHITYALIAINVVVYGVLYGLMTNIERLDWYRWGANNQFQVFENGEYYRLFTSMFLHAGPAHLMFNMLALYFIGQTVERFFGHARFFIIYLLGGLTGSLLSVVLNGPSVNAVGASGAVFAIIGAEIIFLYNHRKLFGQTAAHQLRQLLILALLNLAYGFASQFSDAAVQLDNWGHIGGLIGGLGLAYLIGPIFLLKRREGTEVDFEAIDMQPLAERYQNILAFISGPLIVLILGTFIARGSL